MNDEFSHFPKHVVSVIPNRIESQHFAIHLQKLPQFVKVRGGLEIAGGRGDRAFLYVGVTWALFRVIDLNALTLQEILQDVSQLNF